MVGDCTFFGHVFICKIFVSLCQTVCLGRVLDVLLRIPPFDPLHEEEITLQLILNLDLGCDQIRSIKITRRAILLVVEA